MITKRWTVLWGLLALLASTQSVQATEKVTLYLTDALGSPVAEMDASGNVTYQADYRPYGQQQMGAAQDGPGYTGHVNDPDTGLVYMQARYYDPGTGRFLSVDPVGPSPGDVFGFNRYDYTNNNPINHTDPDGRCIDGVTCGTMLSAHVDWRMSHPGAPADGMEKAAFVGVGVMLTASGAGAAVEIAQGAAVLNKVLSDSRAPVTTLQKNVAQGKAGEALTRAKYGDKIAGEQVTIKTSDGTRTRTDFVTKDQGVIETKTGGANLSTGQTKLFDDINAGREVTPVGKNATNAGLESGKPTVLKSCTVDRC